MQGYHAAAPSVSNLVAMWIIHAGEAGCEIPYL